MKKFFAFAASQRVASLSLGVAIGLALCLAGAPARAENCPRGQFFWKTKKSCIDKAEAAKLGIYHGPVPAAKASDKAETEKPEEPAPEASPASDAAVAPPRRRRGAAACRRAGGRRAAPAIALWRTGDRGFRQGEMIVGRKIRIQKVQMIA